MNLQIEQEIIKRFVSPMKQKRLLYLAQKPKKRADLIWSFHASEILWEKCLVEIPGKEQYSNTIHELMENLGASEKCYGISGIEEIDGKEGKLIEFLEIVVGYTIGTILYCPKTNIGYFEGGHIKDRYVLQSKK